MESSKSEMEKLLAGMQVPADDLERATELTRELYSVLNMQGCRPPIEIAALISLIGAIVKTLPSGPSRELVKVMTTLSLQVVLTDD